MFFLSGALDLSTVPLMNAAIGDAVARGGPLTLDMTDVTFVDSSGVGAIVQSVQSLPSGCIVLRGVQDGVGKVMDLMGVDQAAKLHVIPCTRRSL
jgi:anti-anti-sigma factor